MPIGKLAKSYQSLKARVERVKDKTEETVGEVIKTVEVCGSAGGFAWANERYGETVLKEGGAVRELHVAGMPADLAAGVTLQVLCLLGAAGKYSEHGCNIGVGALACYSVRLAGEMGAKARITSQQPKTATAGALGGGGFQGNPWAQQAAYASRGVG